MLFKDILNAKTTIIAPEFDKLFDLAMSNQYHPGDLLLVHINGFFNQHIDAYNQNQGKKWNPHVIGPGREGHSENTHYQFINKYRTRNIVKVTHAEYLKEVAWDPEKRDLIDRLIELEADGIQIEMLIYLKFWEADLIIKKFYQLARLLNGEPYDWYFKIAESNRSLNTTGTRQDIIRKGFFQKTESFLPKLIEQFRLAFNGQIRNAIAHSNYSFAGRVISLLNFVKEDQYSQKSSLTFDEWIEIFHITMVIYNEYIRLNNRIGEFYKNIFDSGKKAVDVLITEKEGQQYALELEYKEESKTWIYKQ